MRAAGGAYAGGAYAGGAYAGQGAAAAEPEPRPEWTPHQKRYMEKIVQGMTVGNIGIVASTLGEAVRASCHLPDTFLSTVKAWMESRQQSLAAAAARRAAPAPQVGMGSFEGLRQRLEQAIRNKDTQLVPQILKQAADLAAAGGAPPGPGAFTPRMAGASTPAAPGGAETPMVAQQWQGAATPMMVPHAQGAATPMIPQAKQMLDETPRLAGAATPFIAGHGPVKPGDATPMVGQQPMAHTSLQAAAPEPRAPPAPAAAYRRPAPTEDFSPAGPADDGFPAFEPAFEPATATARLQPKKTELHGAWTPGAARVPGLSRSTPSVEQVADALRTTEGDFASFKKLCTLFEPPALKEHLRRIAEGEPDLFTVMGDRVSLRDPSREQAVRGLVKCLIRTPMMRKAIRPDEVHELLDDAADFAMDAVPLEVAKVLMKVSSKTLRTVGKVSKGSHPANMPLVLACLIDKIVTKEREKANSRKFENAFGPLLYRVIFKNWPLGRVPGSNFLANILLSWSHRGLFKQKQLEECKKPLIILTAYARSDGVPDGEDKENGAGWYKIVRGPERVEVPTFEPLTAEVVQTTATPVVGDAGAPAEAEPAKPPQPVASAAPTDASGVQPTVETPVATAQQTVESPADVPSPQQDDEEDAPTEDLFGSPLPDEEDEQQPLPPAGPPGEEDEQRPLPVADPQAAATAPQDPDLQATQRFPDPASQATQAYPEEGLGEPPAKRARPGE